MKILGASSAVALLAACSKTPEPTTARPPATPASTIVPGSQEDLVANVGDRVFFDFDKSVLRADAKDTLDKQAAWLAKYRQRQRAGRRQHATSAAPKNTTSRSASAAPTPLPPT